VRLKRTCSILLEKPINDACIQTNGPRRVDEERYDGGCMQQDCKNKTKKHRKSITIKKKQKA